MKGAVYYHSRWGNCGKAAEAIAEGLSESGHEVELAAVTPDTTIPGELDFIVVGGPTRAGKATRAVRRFIKRNIGEDWKGRGFAAFGTGFASAREKGEPQSAEHIYMLLSYLDLKPLADPFKVGVEGLKGPLAQGELIKCVKFGIDLGESLAKAGDWKAAGRPQND